MSTTSKAAFDAEVVWLAEGAKALGHPARLAILKTLAERDTCICGELVAVLPLAQATVSQHLKALKKAGFIDGTIDGPRSCYCLNHEALARLQAAFTGLFASLDGSSCC